jgi:hypothetical protein
VTKEGKLDVSNSKNVSSAYEEGGPGLYCLEVTVPFKNAVGSVDDKEGSGWLSVQLEGASSECNKGAANVFVQTSTEKSAFNKEGFYISFN